MSEFEEDSLVKSRQRIEDHGEVFTPSWLVEEMLNLVKDESERIDSHPRLRHYGLYDTVVAIEAEPI